MGGDDGAVPVLTATVLLGLHTNVHVHTLGRDDGAILILHTDQLLNHMCTVGGNDGVIIPADGLINHMCTVGGMMVQYSQPMDSSIICVL